ncbi:MAG: hypothetical protein DIZ80_05000 [endosymbiont of Galathealinum brachiosum]|uniref:Uncharacterized protein n=1 Tax=endosymbiont of Galathealinum brachiosum TaxID=2200906 RepID=A0A370DIS9_9GAMM|nr:MAG: hypothetical protein DIZ80_05000 [endosymbiont of Galathealinum brachiosum]
MSFDVNQMPGSSEKKVDESEAKAAGLKRFKYWFAGVVLVCLSVIVGAAIFYYLLNDLGYKI